MTWRSEFVPSFPFREKDIFARIPELGPLRRKSVLLVGLGCIGAPIAIELAKAGVQELTVVDPDHVEPATVVRWPLGISSAALPKVLALARWISVEYPFTKVTPHQTRLGAIRTAPHQQSDADVIEETLGSAHIIVDATGEGGVQQYLSDQAIEHQIPYVGVEGTWGGWGGHVFRWRPSTSAACWRCYELSRGSIIPKPPSKDQESDAVQPRGCTSPTFTGSAFEMSVLSLLAVRITASTLCAGVAGSFPECPYDAIHVRLRSEDGGFSLPHFDGYKIAPHPECSQCNP